jgi:dephospho-CoA kinase
MIVVGLTGSIAMGKSTLAQMLRELGAPVFDADAAVRELYRGETGTKVEAEFPGVLVDGAVDRERLARYVVNDSAAMKRLEAIVHPAVAERRTRFLEEARRAGARAAILDVPLLFETGGERHCDVVVVVSAPPDIQRRRAFERPGMTEGKFAALVGKQVPDAEKRRRADFIVDSSQSFDHARAQVRDILRAIAKMRESRDDSAN